MKHRVLTIHCICLSLKVVLLLNILFTSNKVLTDTLTDKEDLDEMTQKAAFVKVCVVC